MATSRFMGRGDVVGPASATDGALCAFDGTTGKLIKVGSGLSPTFATVTATTSVVIGAAVITNPSATILGLNGSIETGAGSYVWSKLYVYVGPNAGTQGRIGWLAEGSLELRTAAGADTGKFTTNVVNATGKFQLNGVDGFTGTGAYTNFTIVGGIITAAS
jgi:hypothetical protein